MNSIGHLLASDKAAAVGSMLAESEAGDEDLLDELLRDMEADGDDAGDKHGESEHDEEEHDDSHHDPYVLSG